MSIEQLQQEFDSAISSEQAENIEKVLIKFDHFCREQVESEPDTEAKRALIHQLISVENHWRQEIFQLKAKVQGKIADIRSNSKKINKYLTSF